jgi:glycosyltransferase involved in cell wall biosynthesis
MDVYIIIPFHNEEQYIKSTIESIINQSYAVKKLLLVNDNSNDKSYSLVKKYVETYDWISEISIKSIQKHLPGEKVIKAFNFGLNNIDNNYDIICKFDADIILPNNYIEKIVSFYQKDTSLGMASGVLFIKKKSKWVYENIASKKHVRGPIKSYRKQCFKDIGGLKESIGWDTIDVLLSKYNKWNTKTDTNLIVKHQKETGANYDKSAKFLQGEALYKMRFGIILSVLSALKRAYNKKSLAYFVYLIVGYLKASINKIDALVTEKEGEFIRNLT